MRLSSLGILGSKEETEDLKEAYLQSEGDMDEIMDSIMCATVDDEVRFTKILKDLIKKKEIPDYPAFTKESKTKKTARKRRVGIVYNQSSNQNAITIGPTVMTSKLPWYQHHF